MKTFLKPFSLQPPHLGQKHEADFYRSFGAQLQFQEKTIIAMFNHFYFRIFKGRQMHFVC